MKTSDQKLNNKKMKKKKKVSKMKKIIIKNAMAIVAIAIAMGSYALMSFDSTLELHEFGREIPNPSQPDQFNWIPLEGLKENVDYECTDSEETCKDAFESHQINPSTNLPYPNETPVSSTPGTFAMN